MTLVETPSGRVRGRTGDDGVARFLGIRYARPPVGALRLRPAVAAEPWIGEFDATEFAPQAVQPSTMLVPRGQPEDEDCLALNVWTPDPGASLPVMVWIHGGSFTTGNGSLTWYDGARLASRSVVVVTINYRLGALGFLHLEAIGGEEWSGSANLGLGDQALAFEWVRDHIASFGGDPARVTIFGESAGGMSVSVQLTLPSSKGLFARAIVQSGATRHVQSAEASADVAERVLAFLGVETTDLGSIADVPAARFAEATEAITGADRRHALPLPFRPTVDGSTLPIAPVDALAAGAATGIPVLAGTTRDEMNLFRFMAALAGHASDLDEDRLLKRVARLLDGWGSAADPAAVVATYRRHHPAASPVDLWWALNTDTTFRMPLVEMLDAHADAGGEAYAYMFMHRSTGFGGALGAAHATEIPFVFDNLHQRGTAAMLGDIDAAREQFSSSLADRWVDFACDRPLTIPGTSEPWPAHDTDRRPVALLDIESSVADRFEDDVREIWLR